MPNRNDFIDPENNTITCTFLVNGAIEQTIQSTGFLSLDELYRKIQLGEVYTTIGGSDVVLYVEGKMIVVGKVLDQSGTSNMEIEYDHGDDYELSPLRDR